MNDAIETVEESTSSKSIFESEMRNIRFHVKRLEDENMDLKDRLQSSPHHTVQESSSLAPGLVLSSVTKKIAKKLGADAFTSQDDELRDETELLKNQNKFFEEEMKALKDKLRAADEELQRCRQRNGHCDVEETNRKSDNLAQLEHTATNTSFENKSMSCDMCSNYEAQLVKEQKMAADLRAKLTHADIAVEKQKEYVLKEIGFRKDMEEKWNEKRDETKTQVIELTKRTATAEGSLDELQVYFKQQITQLSKQLTKFSTDREELIIELNKIQGENDVLIGKHSIRSHEMDSEFINLPDNIEELQVFILKMRDDLYNEKVGKEMSEERFNTVSSEMLLMKESFAKTEEQMQHMHRQLNDAVHFQEKKIDEKVDEYKLRIRTLQEELENNEMVQKDFVHLSQNLQRELEKFRVPDCQVRWQHHDDVVKCPGCRDVFDATGKKKVHCSHCIQIFCETCLRHTVMSGPTPRPFRVCDVCHTLLDKDSAPYFSKEVPQSPD